MMEPVRKRWGGWNIAVARVAGTAAENTVLKERMR